MKIRLTEHQYNIVKLLKEQTEFLDKYKTQMHSLKESVNKIYTKVTFSSLAEFISGEIDIDVINQELSRLDKINQNQETKLGDFFDKMPEDEYNKHWSRIHMKLEDLPRIIFWKINALENLIGTIKTFIEDSDISKKFDDIKPTEI